MKEIIERHEIRAALGIVHLRRKRAIRLRGELLLCLHLTAQLRNRLWRALPRTELHDIGLHRLAYETRIHHRLDRDFAHEGAALWADFQKPLFREFDKGFAHRLAAQSEPRPNLRLGDPHSGAGKLAELP